MRANALVAIALIVGRASLAAADEGNYEPYPLGERALGMGGALVAAAGDPAATYYNPAGLAFGRTSSLSGTLSVYGVVSRTVENGGFYLAYDPEPDEEGRYRPRLVDLEYHEFPPATIPTTVVLVRRMGPRFPDRAPRQAVAWSTLVPRASDLRYSFSVRNDFDDDPSTAPDDHRVSLRESDKVILVGPSYAFRITPSLAIGLSAFGVIRTFSHSYHHTMFNESDDPSLRGMLVRELDIESTVYSLLARVGIQWEPRPGWRLGLMVGTPSLQVYDEASYALRDLETFTGEFVRDEDSGIRAHDLQPLTIRLGFARDVPSSYSLAVDVSFFGPATYDRLDLSADWTGIYFANRVRRGCIANVAAGAEVLLARRWPVRLGFFTDLSAAAEIVDSDTPAIPRINVVGGTLTLGYRASRFDINLGVVVGVGDGLAQTVGPQGTTGDTPTYVPTDARETRLYFVITGVERALGRLVGDWIDI